MHYQLSMTSKRPLTGFLLCAVALLAWVAAARAEEPFRFESTPGKLPKDVVPVQYNLSLSPDIEKRTFTGSETVDIEIKKATSRCVLNAADLDISAAELTPTGQAAAKGVGEHPAIALDATLQTCTLTFPLRIARRTPTASRCRFAGKINSDGSGLFAATYDCRGGRQSRDHALHADGTGRRPARVPLLG